MCSNMQNNDLIKRSKVKGLIVLKIKKNVSLPQKLKYVWFISWILGWISVRNRMTVDKLLQASFSAGNLVKRWKHKQILNKLSEHLVKLLISALLVWTQSLFHRRVWRIVPSKRPAIIHAAELTAWRCSKCVFPVGRRPNQTRSAELLMSYPGNLRWADLNSFTRTSRGFYWKQTESTLSWNMS